MPLRRDLTKSAPLMAQKPEASPFHFECPMTVFKADEAPEGKKRRIAGIVSTDNVDKQNERILQEGLDFTDFLAGGWYNNDHRQDMTDVLGYPETVKQFKQGDTLPDGTTAAANCTWVEGYLLETKKAAEVWELGQALQKTHRRLGYSVEGSIEERTGANDSVIARAKVRNIAITASPVNGDSRLEILARSLNAHNAILKRAMTLTDAQGSQGPVRPNRAYTGQGAGQVLSRESIGGGSKKRRRPKTRTLTRSQAVAYVKSQVPGIPEALARAIVHTTLHPSLGRVLRPETATGD